MSFSSEVKAELCRTALSRRCCAQAEAYGVLLYCNQFTASQVRISTESTAFAARLPALFHRAFQLSFDRTPEEGAAKQIFSITEPDKLSALWSAFGHEPAGTLAHHINFAVLEEEETLPWMRPGRRCVWEPRYISYTEEARRSCLPGRRKYIMQRRRESVSTF